MKEITPDNPLNNIYEEFSKFPAMYRDLVCRECNWSYPTFYRKKNELFSAESKSKNQLSQAERDAVIKVSLTIVDHIVKFTLKSSQHVDQNVFEEN
ncbi:hypothetical protein ACTJJ0_11230 [Chitinophaga sp. 22321]|uniref:hypothetical protein n=1 Tax=Chitinophaga sp. 22321 TaxID=3453909 RepID=UPI003F8432A6